MRSLIPSEFAEQVALCEWMDLKKIPYYAIPNGFCANAREGAKMKRSGLKPGIPDLCVPVKRGEYGALYIELKRKAGSYVSAAQQSWIDYLNGAGYLAVACKGWEYASRVIENYLSEVNVTVNDESVII